MSDDRTSAEHTTETPAEATTPATDTTTVRGNGPVWTGRRWAKPAAAGVGLVLIGGLGGFALGHSTAGGDDLTPTSFQPGQQGGPGDQPGQPGQGAGGLGQGTPPQGGSTGELPQSGQPGQSGTGSGSSGGDSTT